jgi:hypothetical protein
MFLVRLCSALLSAFVLTVFLSRSSFYIWSLLCGWRSDELCYENFDMFRQVVSIITVVGGVLWIISWLTLEILARYRSHGPRSRLLTHLRYGPITILLLSIGAVLITDMALIQYSRWQIVNYIHSDAPPLRRPTFNLHDDYRSFCGNGFAPHRYAVYGSTPAEYLDDPDPGVRARALHASVYLQDRWANPPNSSSLDLLGIAANDPDWMVRTIAAEYYVELFGNSFP